uniref:Uncharacterized protein n=1 Tax=Manihot esculenta TaxID=3983 RepID=A0A2C9V835_MANES
MNESLLPLLPLQICLRLQGPDLVASIGLMPWVAFRALYRPTS